MMRRRDLLAGGIAVVGAAATRAWLPGAQAQAAAISGPTSGAIALYKPAPLPGTKRAADADDSGRIVPPPPPGYWRFRGTSGPGLPATAASASGGWTSGMPDVRYRGSGSPPYSVAPWNNADAGTAVKAGLLPRIRPLHDVHIRDTIVCLGGDGYYYMTGSTGDNIWAKNDGVELWRSKDLDRWEYRGLIWSIERDGRWERNWRMRAGVPFRALWAPEIHYIRGNYYLCHSISRAGLAVLKSTSGRAEGPYVHAFSPDAPIRRSIDATLFEDPAGGVWLTYGSAGEIVRLKDDLSGLAADWQPMTAVEWDLDPLHHRAPCAAEGCRKFGYEGATMFVREGVYYLGVVDRFQGRYSFRIWLSDQPTGPWREPHEGAPCCGGGNIFRDHQGRWWQTFFGNDDASHFREKPGIVRIDFDARGHVIVHRDQPFLIGEPA